MRDLLTNIKKAIEILNKNKNLTISLTDPEEIISDQIPVGVSIQEFEDSLHYILSDLLFTADDLAINFDCTFHIDDLRVEEYNSTKYMEAMQRIIKEIYDRYKWAMSFGTTHANLKGSQTITGTTHTYNNAGTLAGVSLGNSTSTFSSIYADDVMLNGSTSVKSTIDDLEQENTNLKNRLAALEVIVRGLMNK